MRHPAIDDDTMTELRRFAADRGRTWKSQLNWDYWFKALDVPGYPRLYALRNSHGPTWLYNFRFSKA